MARFQLWTVIEAPIERVYELARDIDLHTRSMAHAGDPAPPGRPHAPLA